MLASALAGRLILPGHGFTPAHGYPPPASPSSLSLTSGPDLRAAGGSVLYLALIALLALGTATAVRDSAVPIGAVLGLLYLFPVIASALSPHRSRLLQQIGPMSAGLCIQATTGPRGLPLSPGRISACSPCGPRGHSSPAVWCSGCATHNGPMPAMRVAQLRGAIILPM